MNLAHDPTTQQLANLLARCDDEAGNHLLWVDKDGNVHIDLLNGLHPYHDIHPSKWPNAKFRFETYAAGLGYTGLDTSRETKYVDTLYKVLIDKWTTGAVGFIDTY